MIQGRGMWYRLGKRRKYGAFILAVILFLAGMKITAADMEINAESMQELSGYLGQKLEMAAQNFDDMQYSWMMSVSYYRNSDVVFGASDDSEEQKISRISIIGKNNSYRILGLSTAMSKQEACEMLEKQGFVQTNFPEIYVNGDGYFVNLKELEDSENPGIELTALPFPEADRKTELFSCLDSSFDEVAEIWKGSDLKISDGKMYAENIVFEGTCSDKTEEGKNIVSEITIYGTDSDYCLYGISPGGEFDYGGELTGGGTGERIDPAGNILIIFYAQDPEKPRISLRLFQDTTPDSSQAQE